MKTLKVDNELYDKVRSLSDASGESLIAAANGVVSAGLGELKGLANSLKNDTDIIIAEPNRKPKVDKVEEVGVEEVGVEEANGGNGWLWVAGALIGILALRQRIQRNGILHFGKGA